MNRSDESVPQGEFEGGDASAEPDSRPQRGPGNEAAAAGGAQAPPPADGERGEASNERGDGERGERGRRRGRRDRRRGEAGEGDAAGNRPRRAPMLPLPPNFEGPLPLHLQPVVPPEAGAVFAKLLSGDFDADAEAPVETEEAAGKRVLAAEPDAPKLHKVLAQAGIGSRRDMEDLIVEGRIMVNGEPAHTGQRISFGDRIEVDGKPVRVRIVPPPARILAYHKPAGEIVTNDDPEHRPTVFRRLPRLHQGKWQSVGRLDINTEGLLLFTNSGGLANQLMHPRFGVEREYAVRVMGTLGDAERAQLLDGVEVEGQRAAFKSIVNGGGEGLNTWYRVVITEGRNREVRKLFEAVGLTVSRLIRIRYGTVVLPLGLKRGVWVDLDEADVKAIRRLAHPQGDGQRNDARPEGAGSGPRRDDRGPRNNNNNNNNNNSNRQGNDRNRQQGPRRPDEARFDVAPGVPVEQAPRPAGDDEIEDDFDPSRIPNPLQQTFDHRFVQGRRIGPNSGFGAGGSAPRPSAGPKGDPKQPDPLQTSMGYIGADAVHRKNRGGNRGGGFGGGGGGGRSGGGGGGGGGFGGGGGGRRGR